MDSIIKEAIKMRDDYVKAWEWYKKDCAKDGEKVVIDFERYCDIMPYNEVLELIKYNNL